MCDEKAMFTLQRQVARLTATLAALSGGGAVASMTQQGSMGYQQPAQGKLIMNGSTMPPQVPSTCGGQQACPPSLVSAATEAAIKSGPRTANVPIVLGALAAGASTFATVASNSIERTLVLTDLVSTVANLDGLRFTLLIGDNVTGREVDSFNGGRFARGNANDCTTACGFGACVGPIETLTIRVTNISGAALAAGSTANVDVRSIYRNEPGFSCGDCYTPGGSGMPGQANFPGSDQPVG